MVSRPLHLCYSTFLPYSGGVNWGILEATPVSVSVIAVIGTTTRPSSIGVLRWSVLSRGDSRLCVRDCRYLYDYTAGVNWSVEVVSAVRGDSRLCA